MPSNIYFTKVIFLVAIFCASADSAVFYRPAVTLSPSSAGLANASIFGWN